MPRNEDDPGVIGGADRFRRKGKDSSDQDPEVAGEETEASVVGSLGIRLETFLHIPNKNFKYSLKQESPVGTDFIRVRAGEESVDTLVERLHKTPYAVSFVAERFLQGATLTTPEEPEDIELVCLRGGSLGVDTEAELYERAGQLGLRPCEPIDALLCRRIKDQDVGSNITVAVNPVSDPSGEIVPVLRKRQEGLSVLDARMYNSSNRVMTNDGYIFRLPKKPRQADEPQK